MFKILENYFIGGILFTLAGGLAGVQIYLQKKGISNPFLNAFVASAIGSAIFWLKNPPKK